MHRCIAAAFGATLLFLSACNGDAVSSSTGSPPGGTSGKAAKVSVFAATSLEESFGETEKRFESARPDIDLVSNLVGSQEFVKQIDSGTPADVVATANVVTMDALKSGDRITDTKVFASNTLVLITPRGNPAKVTGLNSSLGKARLVIRTPKASVSGKTVPCGTATAELVRRLGVKLSPVSKEQKVADARSKVMSSEADTDIVCRVDAVAGGKEVETIEIPSTDTVVDDYPVGVAKASKNSSKAKAFTECITSRGEQATLKKHSLNEAGAGEC